MMAVNIDPAVFLSNVNNKSSIILKYVDCGTQGKCDKYPRAQKINHGRCDLCEQRFCRLGRHHNYFGKNFVPWDGLGQLKFSHNSCTVMCSCYHEAHRKPIWLLKPLQNLRRCFLLGNNTLYYRLAMTIIRRKLKPELGNSGTQDTSSHITIFHLVYSPGFITHTHLFPITGIIITNDGNKQSVL